MSADLLRRAAAKMRDFGPIHEAIAEGLMREADLADEGRPIDQESLDLARAYDEETADD